MAARIALIALCCLLALPLSPTTARAADDCTAAAPEPTLQRDSYPSQSFRRRSDNRALETARLAGGVALDIEYAGCADAVSRTVTLRVERGSGIRGPWPAFAHDTLRDLRADATRRWFDPRLLRFLATLAKHPPEAGKVERCFDDSRPGNDGCAFETGGGFGFEVREEPTRTTVIVHQYDLI